MCSDRFARALLRVIDMDQLIAPTTAAILISWPALPSSSCETNIVDLGHRNP
jgi:hypothetical protein